MVGVFIVGGQSNSYMTFVVGHYLNPGGYHAQ